MKFPVQKAVKVSQTTIGNTLNFYQNLEFENFYIEMLIGPN